MSEENGVLVMVESVPRSGKGLEMTSELMSTIGVIGGVTRGLVGEVLIGWAFVTTGVEGGTM